MLQPQELWEVCDETTYPEGDAFKDCVVVVNQNGIVIGPRQVSVEGERGGVEVIPAVYIDPIALPVILEAPETLRLLALVEPLIDRASQNELWLAVRASLRRSGNPL